MMIGLFEETADMEPMGLFHGLLESLSPIIALLIAGVFSFLMVQDRFRTNGKISSLLSSLSYLPRKKFFVDEVYQLLIVRPLRGLSRFLASFFEHAVIDHSIQSAGVLAVVSGFCLQKLHSGSVRSYLISFVLSAVFLVSVCLLMI